jgi:hypothetical protein
VEPSEEIRRVIERWTMSVAEGDRASILGRLSKEPGTLIIGSDPAEWWRDTDARDIWARQIEEIERFPVTATEIEAWEEGSVGWAGVKETVDWEGKALESRATYVLHLERGEWKVVQVHWSFPRAHLEPLGRSLTVSLDELERTVQRERPDLSASRAVDGTVTIVFTDIVDSTPALARLGDLGWLEVIQRHNRVISDVTAAHGGAVVETQGDGSMLAFSSALPSCGLCSGYPTRDRTHVRRLPTAHSREDRHPYRGRHQGRGALLRHHRALRRAGREPG